MQHYPEVVLMQLLDHLLGVRKNARVPGKRAVLRIPARWAEPGPQVNQSIAGKLLFTECFRLCEHLFPGRKCAVRLLISETPQRRDFCMPCQVGVFGHNRGWIRRYDNENVERKRGVRIWRYKFALRAAEIERSKRVMKEHRPTGGAD